MGCNYDLIVSIYNGTSNVKVSNSTQFIAILLEYSQKNPFIPFSNNSHNVLRSKKKKKKKKNKKKTKI